MPPEIVCQTLADVYTYVAACTYLRTNSHSPELVFQMRAVPSIEAETHWSPSKLNKTFDISAVCPTSSKRDLYRIRTVAQTPMTINKTIPSGASLPNTASVVEGTSHDLVAALVEANAYDLSRMTLQKVCGALEKTELHEGGSILEE